MITINDHKQQALFDPWAFLSPKRRRLLDEGWDCKFFIALEPTDLNICYAHKGGMWVELQLPGTPAHGSRPWAGHNPLADLARGTHLPIATGERIFTKWGFREILEKRAAAILQPDLCHAGGIHEVHLIAGMAEAYYASIAPHNPLGPISLAACIQLDATIPNFIAQEHVSLGEGYLKQPFVAKDGYVELPTAPGLGIELDEEALADKIDHDWRNPESYHPDDGSVVDW